MSDAIGFALIMYVAGAVLGWANAHDYYPQEDIYTKIGMGLFWPLYMIKPVLTTVALVIGWLFKNWWKPLRGMVLVPLNTGKVLFGVKELKKGYR